VKRRTNAQERRGGGAGRGGTRGDSGRRGHGRERGAELGVEDAPDRRAPPVGDHVREREGSGALAGLLGRKRGLGRAAKKKKKREERWAAGWVWG
jgi:hypothetical protein